jgi:hypothetical protein
MKQLEEFLNAGGTVSVVDPHRLKATEQNDILQLIERSAAADYSERSAAEMAYYMRNTGANFAQSVPVPGNPFTHDNQTFLERRIVLAHLDGSLQAALSADINISGRFGGRLGIRERQVKHYLGTKLFDYGKFVYYRLGQRAIRPGLYTDAEFGNFDPHDLTVLDGLGFVAVGLAVSLNLQTSAYPHEGERQWAPTLFSWGLGEIIDEQTLKTTTEPKHVFGPPPVEPVTQTPMRGPSVRHVKRAIREKDDAARVLPALKRKMNYHLN